MVHQKGFDILLRAFSIAQRDRPGWRLVILGEGPERPRLIRLSDELGIRDRVELRGTVDEPATVLANADIFVLSSRFEGYPNALLEAMAHGLPVVSANCRSGPEEIIDHGVNGLLVPPGEAESMSRAMAQLMDDRSVRQVMGDRARLVIQRHDVRTIVSKWDEVIEAVTKADR